MTCPTCALTSAPDDRICRRCKRDFLTDRRIGTQPQRAKGRWRQHLPRRQNVAIAAAIIPGVGHAVVGQPWRGLGYLITVAWVVQLGLGAPWRGLVFVGIAAAIHAASIMDLARPSLPHYASLPVQICLTLVLVTVMYHPAWSAVLEREGSLDRLPLDIRQPPSVGTVLLVLSLLLVAARVLSGLAAQEQKAGEGEA